MNKKISNKTIFMLLISSLLLGGCGKKSDCDLPFDHVHKYVKFFDDDIKIEKYLKEEKLDLISGYHWRRDYIEITKEDEEFYKLLKKKRVI